jgi:hypothetical protein
VLAEFEGIEVSTIGLLEHEHQLVLGAVKRAHAGVVLGPHDQVLGSQALLAARAGQFEQVPPVHEHEQDGSVPGMGLRTAEERRKERGEFGFRHLAGRHRELFVTDLAKAGDVAIDTDVEWGIGKDQIGSLAFQQPNVIAL